MIIKSIFTIITTATLGGILHAQENTSSPRGIAIQPGLYNVTVSQTNSAFVNGKRETQPTQSNSGQQCLELPDNIVLPEYYNKPGCTISVGDSDKFNVSYQMNCQNGAQKLAGHFKLSAGHLNKLLAPDDLTTLPDGRTAFKLFTVSGTLSAKTNDVEAYQDSEQAYTYVGPCLNK